MSNRRDPRPGREDGQDFELLLPMDGTGAAMRPTHVVTMHGKEAEFVVALHDVLLEDELAASALRGPVGTMSLGHLADILNAVGGAAVQSVDRV